MKKLEDIATLMLLAIATTIESPRTWQAAFIAWLVYAGYRSSLMVGTVSEPSVYTSGAAVSFIWLNIWLFMLGRLSVRR